MDLEINKSFGIPNTAPIKEIQLAKTDLNVYLGQAVKAVVLTSLNNNEVTININGQNFNARTSHQFTPGERLDAKVINVDDEIVLQIQQKFSASALQKTVLQSALLQALPQQSPPGSLIANLQQLLQSRTLPNAITQQIRTLLASIPQLTQLPQQLSAAINQSGVFLESSLLEWQTGTSSAQLQADFKGQYLKLLDSLPDAFKNQLALNKTQGAELAINRDNIPLPGAIPQPLHKEPLMDLMGKSAEMVQSILHEQVSQVLSRITANQISHLNSDENKNGFFIMLDLPIKVSAKDIDVIPLMIKQRKATSTTATDQWSISFAVSLSELGDLQGHITLEGNNVHVKINTEQAETINTLQEYRPEMDALLEELGLKLGNFNIQVGLENNQIDTENLHLLDLRV